MTNIKRECRSCKYAEWPKDKRGRNMYHRTGKCTYVLELPLIPECTNEGPYRNIDSIKKQLLERRYLYGGDAGQNCECYEEKP